MSLKTDIEMMLGKPIAMSDNSEIYGALLQYVKKQVRGTNCLHGNKKLYYISAEFLIGKLLSNNLINLGIYDELKKILEEEGKSLADIEEIEREPSLGNGGLGRLAACFIDSMATLGINGEGVGLYYHYGLFKQVFEENQQKEKPNPWIDENSWCTKRQRSYQIALGAYNVKSVLYDIDVIGYNNHVTKLHLFDVESIDESIVRDGIKFDKEDISKNLTLFLYPDDSDDKGRMLRIYQQYFMVSNAARMIIDEAIERGSNLHDLAEYVVVQINDTHPSMIIPELIRLLGERGIGMDEAISIVTKTCAYTNHTILAEALEKWPIEYLEKAVPQLMPIIYELDNRIRDKVEDASTYIVKDGLVHMAHMDIHYGFSVNGVAYLHTEILKESELNAFYRLYPEKFNNKTNGITFRRWLMSCNPELANYITELIGDGWKKDAGELEKLAAFANDATVLERIQEIKTGNKEALAAFLMKTQGVSVDPNSIFDIQVKRLHEYKRQQLNVIYLIDKYLNIKAGMIPKTGITAIFGAKAAPAYTTAKDIIHLIICMQQIIASDPEVSKYLNVIMVENYNVTAAEKLIPACDVSEQISLASKEASGTGNMKFMLNGAITLGTMDGANVEIAELVGPDAIYTFGDSSAIVIERYQKHTYRAKDYYDSNPSIKRAVDFIIGEEMLKVGNAKTLKRLHDELLNKDWFMTFPDFEEYKITREKVYEDYEDKNSWAVKALTNISKGGFFSSDRTIAQYNEEIWKLEQE